jgi:hypothetical protein
MNVRERNEMLEMLFEKSLQVRYHYNCGFEAQESVLRGDRFLSGGWGVTKGIFFALL